MLCVILFAVGSPSARGAAEPEFGIRFGIVELVGPNQFQKGGFISYSPDLAAVGPLAAGYIDKILKGARPADLPVQEFSQYELVINLKTAKALGVAVPRALVARADQVIE